MLDYNAPTPAFTNPIIANSGITLRLVNNGYVAFPKGPAIEGVSEAGVQFTRIFSGQIERVAGTSRALWHQRQRAMTTFLYFDLRQSTWVAFVPPQLATPTEVRVDCRFPEAGAPSPDSRIAGSILSLPNRWPDESRLCIPPFDGMHFVVDPCKSWMSLQSHLRTEGSIIPVNSDDLIADQHEADLPSVLSVVRLTDSF